MPVRADKSVHALALLELWSAAEMITATTIVMYVVGLLLGGTLGFLIGRNYK